MHDSGITNDSSTPENVNRCTRCRVVVMLGCGVGADEGLMEYVGAGLGWGVWVGNRDDPQLVMVGSRNIVGDLDTEGGIGDGSAVG
jgi:hypothetical protein